MFKRLVVVFMLLFVLVLSVAAIVQAADPTWDVSTISFDAAPLYTIGLALLTLAGVLVVFRRLKGVIR